MYLSRIHCIQRTIRRGVIAAAAIAALATAHAQVPDRDWPSVVPTPAIDIPMRDTAITRGTDPAGGGAGGTYYLTGTLGVPIQNPKSKIQNELEFDNAPHLPITPEGEKLVDNAVWDVMKNQTNNQLK